MDYVVNHYLQSELPTATTNTTKYPTESMQEIYASDKLHWNTTGYIIVTKQMLSNLGFDYSTSKFLDF